MFIYFSYDLISQSTGAVEYTNSPPNACLGYDTKKTDEVSVMLELWRMWSTPSLPSLPGLPEPGVVALDRVLSMGQIELNCVLMLNWIIWNRTVYMYKVTGSLAQWVLFANDVGSIPGRVIPKTLKMVLETPSLNTQEYKVRIGGKVEQSKERSGALLYTSV